MEAAIAVLFLLLIVAFIAWLRAYGYPSYLKEKDPLAGNTKEEKFKNWILMTTLLWATIVPFFAVLPIMMQLGGFIAIQHGIQTNGQDANVWYALGYLLLIALPVSAMSSLLGKTVWKRIAGRYVPKRLLKKVLDDKWWKRAGGD